MFIIFNFIDLYFSWSNWNKVMGEQ